MSVCIVFGCVSHPNRQGQTLVPLWIGVLLQNLTADLEMREKCNPPEYGLVLNSVLGLE